MRTELTAGVVGEGGGIPAFLGWERVPGPSVLESGCSSHIRSEPAVAPGVRAPVNPSQWQLMVLRAGLARCPHHAMGTLLLGRAHACKPRVCGLWCPLGGVRSPALPVYPRRLVTTSSRGGQARSGRLCLGSSPTSQRGPACVLLGVTSRKDSRSVLGDLSFAVVLGNMELIGFLKC